mgnify:CR=1 FL=1
MNILVHVLRVAGEVALTILAGRESGLWTGLAIGVFDKVELHPTIIKDKDGFTLKVYLSNCPKDLTTYSNPGKFDPWLGSWQIGVRS